MSEALTLRAVENSYLQISVSATSTLLGDRLSYPNYYKVIPDDSKQIEVITFVKCILFAATLDR